MPVNFFISYTQLDQRWAEWIEWTLDQAGFTTVVQFLDMRPGTHFPIGMDDAVRTANRTIAVLSSAYEKSAYASVEWTSIFVQDPTGAKQKLVPVRVEDYQPSGILASIVYIDLVGVTEPTANQRLLEGLQVGRRPRSSVPPPFPDSL
jgi:hypothetical protein